MKTTNKTNGPRQRIINTACELFYTQGYRATGINQVIKESGVAKASFYDHFPSKSDLLNEYVCEMSRRDMVDLREAVGNLKTAEERFFAPFTFLAEWFEMTNYRGCPFQNALAELSSDDGDAQESIRRHRQLERDYFAELAQEFLVDEGGCHDLDCDNLAGTYLLIFEGAIATVSSCRDLWPIEKAIETMKLFVHHSNMPQRGSNG